MPLSYSLRPAPWCSNGSTTRVHWYTMSKQSEDAYTGTL